MPREERPEVRRPTADDRLVPADGYLITEWSPDPTHKAGPTQVHLIMPLVLKEGEEPVCHLVTRMKSRRAIQEMIDVLTEKRDSVWPPQGRK
jgi:hypothetical protein